MGEHNLLRTENLTATEVESTASHVQTLCGGRISFFHRSSDLESRLHLADIIAALWPIIIHIILTASQAEYKPHPQFKSITISW
jgi:hypothetical protein